MILYSALKALMYSQDEKHYSEIDANDADDTKTVHESDHSCWLEKVCKIRANYR